MKTLLLLNIKNRIIYSRPICFLFRMFKTYDDNGSRMLDREELKNGLREYGLNMSKDEQDQLFTCFDKDGSGSISFDEFLLALRVGFHVTWAFVNVQMDRFTSIKYVQNFQIFPCDHR